MYNHELALTDDAAARAKVTAHVLEPMKALWGAKFDEYTTAAFVADLGRYDEKTLDAAVASLRRTDTRRPNLARLLGAVRAELATDAPSVHRNEPQRLTDQQIDQVMRSYEGQVSFAEGYWWELWQYLRYKATSTDLTMETIGNLKAECRRVPTDSEMEAKIALCQSDARESFGRMWETMKARRWQVYSTYSPNQAA